MTENNVANGNHSSNAAFVAVPWAKTLRLETETYIPATWMQLYPVIASYAYPDGCFLSQDKMAAYAGMQKDRVGETIEALVKNKWICSRKVGIHYRLSLTETYSPGISDPGNFYMIGVELIENGVWAAFEQTRQVIYSVMQAWTVHPALAASYEAFAGSGEFSYELVREIDIDGTPLCNNSFLPLSRFDPKKIKASVINSRIAWNDKKLQRALQYFQNYRLMNYDEGFDEDGFFFPRKPGLEDPLFKEKLKKIDVTQADHKITYAAKRARHAAIKRSLEGPVKSKFDKAQ